MFLPQNHNLQMSSCLSGGGGGGGRAYAFELEIIKSPSSTSTTRNSNTSSSPPSSTLSESSNSGLAITTRKPRTPRKRPNQTYNEAAALLSTAYPNLFSTNHLSNPTKFTKLPSPFDHDSPELLLPFRVVHDPNSGYLLHHQNHHHTQKSSSRTEPKLANSACQSPGEFDSRPNSNCDSELMDIGENFTTTGCALEEDDFDAESILDEEIDEGGINSILGNLTVETAGGESGGGGAGFCYGYPMGLGFGARFELGFGIRRGGAGVRALRHVDEGNWWCFPTVDVMELSPKFRKGPASAPEKTTTKKKMKKKVVEKEKEKSTVVDSKSLDLVSGSKLLLKLNYDDVLSAWSDKASPFSDEAPGSDSSPGNDVTVGLSTRKSKSKKKNMREIKKLC